MNIFSWFPGRTHRSGTRRVTKGGQAQLVLVEVRSLTAEEKALLGTERKLPPAVLSHFLELLTMRQVPSESLDSTLWDMSRRHVALSESLRQLPAEKDVVKELVRQAGVALEAAAFARVESLLNEACDAALRAADGETIGAQASLSAAAAKAANGELKDSELAYSEAADYYRQAAALVPPGHELTLARYLQAEGFALVEAGRPNEAEGPLVRALAIREQRLDPMHLDLAESLYYVGWLYDDQGRYAEAEPLYQRSLAIQEKVLGPEHPDTMNVRENLRLLRERPS